MKMMLRGKRLEVFVIVGVLLFMAGIASYVVLSDKDTADEEATEQQEAVYVAPPPYASAESEVIANDSFVLLTNGEPKEALKKIDEYLAASTLTAKEKAFLLQKKASFLSAISVDKSGAINLYKEAIALTPDDPALYAMIGTIYESLGNKDESKKYYQDALSAFHEGSEEEYSRRDRAYYENLVNNGSETEYSRWLQGEW